jgi:hypothetical protein
MVNHIYELLAWDALKYFVTVLVTVTGFFMAGYLKWSHGEIEKLKNSLDGQGVKLTAMITDMALQNQRQEAMLEALRSMQINQEKMSHTLDEMRTAMLKKDLL